MIERVEEIRIIIITDDAGKGKTTTLRQIKKKLLDKKPNHLIVMIDLKQYTSKFGDSQIEFNEETLRSKLETILNITNAFDKKLLKEFLDNGKVCLLLDGFDEIEELSRNFILKLAKAFTASNKNQLWIGSRSHYTTELENNLNQKSFKMLPFEFDGQKSFLVQFWKSENNSSVENLEEIATTLIDKFTKATFSGDFKNFIGIPLQLRMLAEIFKHNLPNIDSFQSFFFDGDKINLYKFYNFFTSKMMEKWVKENPIAFNDCECVAERLQRLRQFHREYAFNVMTEAKNRRTVQEFEALLPFSDELIVKFGILQGAETFQFSHRTFAEFYATQFLMTEILQQKSNLDDLCIAILNNLSYKNGTNVMRTFLNGAMKTKQFDCLTKSDSEFYKKLKQIAYIPNNFEVICEIFVAITIESLDKLADFFLTMFADNGEFLYKILNTRVLFGAESFMHIASMYSDFNTLNVICRHIESIFGEKGLLDFLLNENRSKQICLFAAVKNQDFKSFEMLLEKYKKLLKKKFNSLLNRDDNLNRNLFHYAYHPTDEFHENSGATYYENKEIFPFLLRKFQEFFPEKAKRKFLFNHKNGKTRLHEIIGTPGVSCAKIELFWSFFCEVFDDTERKMKLMEINHKKQNILGALVEYSGCSSNGINGPRDNEQVLYCWLPKLFNALGKEDFKTQILFPGEFGNSFLHKTAAINNKKHFEYVLKFMTKEFELEELKKIFSAKNNLNQNCFERFETSLYNSLPVFKQAENLLEDDDLKAFLKCKNYRGQTFLHCFVLWGNEEEFDSVWKTYRTHLNDEELKEVMLHEEMIGNVLFIAAIVKYEERFKTCWEVAKLFCADEELKKALRSKFISCMEDEKEKYLYDMIKSCWETIRVRTLKEVLSKDELMNLDKFYR
jgi:hypothetical protein